MAQRSFPWTTGSGDGPAGGYSAAQIAEALRGLFGDGVLAGLSTTASGGYNVQVAAGQAMVGGLVYSSDATETLACTALASGERRDLVVVEGNAATRTCRLKVVTGTPGSGSWPALTQQSTFPTSGVWQVEVARLIVTPGNVAVSAPGALAIPRGTVRRSTDWGNALELRANGLYVPQGTTGVKRIITGRPTVPANGEIDWPISPPSTSYTIQATWALQPGSGTLQAPVALSWSFSAARIINRNSATLEAQIAIFCLD